MLVLFAVLRDALRRGVQSAYERIEAFAYAIFFILLFALLYWKLGMKKHFSMPDDLKGREGSFFTGLYTSVLAQSNAMPDTAPQTTLARVLFMLQVCTGWMWFLLFS